MSITDLHTIADCTTSLAINLSITAVAIITICGIDDTIKRAKANIKRKIIKEQKSALNSLNYRYLWKLCKKHQIKIARNKRSKADLIIAILNWQIERGLLTA